MLPCSDYYGVTCMYTCHVVNYGRKIRKQLDTHVIRQRRARDSDTTEVITGIICTFSCVFMDFWRNCLFMYLYKLPPIVISMKLHIHVSYFIGEKARSCKRF